MVGSCGEFRQKHTAKMVNQQKVSGSETWIKTALSSGRIASPVIECYSV